jgi:hypothetical protein
LSESVYEKPPGHESASLNPLKMNHFSMLLMFSFPTLSVPLWKMEGGRG